MTMNKSLPKLSFPVKAKRTSSQPFKGRDHHTHTSQHYPSASFLEVVLRGLPDVLNGDLCQLLAQLLDEQQWVSLQTLKTKRGEYSCIRK